jgi:hypothetical protein
MRDWFPGRTSWKKGEQMMTAWEKDQEPRGEEKQMHMGIHLRYDWGCHIEIRVQSLNRNIDSANYWVLISQKREEQT